MLLSLQKPDWRRSAIVLKTPARDWKYPGRTRSRQCPPNQRWPKRYSKDHDGSSEKWPFPTTVLMQPSSTQAEWSLAVMDFVMRSIRGRHNKLFSMGTKE